MSFSPVSGAAPGGVLCYSTTVANPHLKGSHVVYDVSVNTSRRADPAARSPDDLTELTVVERRYSDFEWLQTALTRTFPFCIIPPLPPKEAYKVLTSKSDQVFVEKRCRFLHFFLARVARHPLLSLSPAFHVFIYAADDATLKAAQDQKLPDLTCAQTLLALDRFRRAAVTLTYTPNDDRLDNPLQTPVSSAILTATVVKGGGSAAALNSGTASSTLPSSSATFDPATALLHLPHIWLLLARGGLVDASASADTFTQPANPFLQPTPGAASPTAAAAAAAGVTAASTSGTATPSHVASAVHASSAAATAALNLLSGMFEGVQGAVTSIGAKVFVRTDNAAAGGGGAGATSLSPHDYSNSHSNGSGAGAGGALVDPAAITPGDVLCARLADYAVHVEKEIRRTKDAVDCLVKGEQQATGALGDVSVVSRAFARYETIQSREGRGGEILITNAITAATDATGAAIAPSPPPLPASHMQAGAGVDDALFGSPDIAKVFDMLATATEKVVRAAVSEDPAAAVAQPVDADSDAGLSASGTNPGAGRVAALLSKVGISSASPGSGAAGGAAAMSMVQAAPTGAALAARGLKEHLSDHAALVLAMGAALARRQAAVDKVKSLCKEGRDMEAKLRGKPGASVPPAGAGADWAGFASVTEPVVRALQVDLIGVREAAAVQRAYVEAMTGELMADIARWRQTRRGENMRAVREFAAAMAAAARAKAQAWGELEAKVKLIA